MAEQLVALDQVDTEEDGDAVVAVLHVAVRVLNQHLHRLPQYRVEQVLPLVQSSRFGLKNEVKKYQKFR